MFFLSGTRMRLCVTLANKSTSLRASVVSRSLGLVGHNLAPTEHFPERASWIKPSDSLTGEPVRERLSSLSGAGRNGSAGIHAQSGQSGGGYKQQPAQACDGPWRSPSRKGEEHGLAKVRPWIRLNSSELTLLTQPWNIVWSPINDKTLGQYGR